jgi:hypothetical protein
VPRVPPAGMPAPSPLTTVCSRTGSLQLVQHLVLRRPCGARTLQPQQHAWAAAQRCRHGLHLSRCATCYRGSANSCCLHSSDLRCNGGLLSMLAELPLSVDCQSLSTGRLQTAFNEVFLQVRQQPAHAPPALSGRPQRRCRKLINLAESPL